MADSGKVSKCKLDVNVKDDSHYTLLHQVVMKGEPLRVEETDVNNLKLLLKFNPDVNIIKALTSEGDNILHLAIKNERSLEMVKIITQAFLDHEVDINLVDKKGFTAIYYAISPISSNQGHYSSNYSHFNFKFTDAAIVQHLVEKGSRIDMVDKNGYSPLLLSVIMRRIDYVKILLDNKDKLSEGALEKTVNSFFYQKEYCQYPPKEYFSMNPLLIAVQENNKEMAQLLVEAGANVNAVNGNTCLNNQYRQMTPLQISVYNCNPEMSEILVKAAADVNVVCSGNNLLQIIIKGNILNEKRKAFKEQTQIAKLLINSEIDINTGSPLQLALKHNKHDIVTAILEKGLDTL